MKIEKSPECHHLFIQHPPSMLRPTCLTILTEVRQSSSSLLPHGSACGSKEAAKLKHQKPSPAALNPLQPALITGSYPGSWTKCSVDSCLKSIIKPGTVLKNIWSVWDRLGVFLINSVLTGCDGRTLLEHSLASVSVLRGGLISLDLSKDCVFRWKTLRRTRD